MKKDINEFKKKKEKQATEQHEEYSPRSINIYIYI